MISPSSGAEQFQVSFAGVTKSMASVYLIRVAPRPNLDLGHRSRLPEPTKSRRRSARTSRDWVAYQRADAAPDSSSRQQRFRHGRI